MKKDKHNASKSNVTWYEMSWDAVSEEVHHQNSAGNEQHSTFRVNIVALSALNVAGNCPGQVGHALYSQLLRQVLLGNDEKKRKVWNCFAK